MYVFDGCLGRIAEKNGRNVVKSFVYYILMYYG